MAQNGKRKALVIGVSDYQDDDLENLDFCKNDANAICEILRKNAYDLPKDRILTGKVNYESMKTAIINFFRDESIHPEDTLLFYFSGHGVLDDWGGRFFANTQIKLKLPEQNGLPFSFLTEQMQKSYSFKKVAILDCCFSGNALAPLTGKAGSKGEETAEKLGRDALSKEFEGSEGNCILASSLSQELSYKLPDKPFSAYTYYVIEALNGVKGAYDEEFCVTPSSLSQYVFSQLKQRHGLKQKPICNLSVAGKIVLVELKRLKKEDSTAQELERDEKSESIRAIIPWIQLKEDGIFKAYKYGWLVITTKSLALLQTVPSGKLQEADISKWYQFATRTKQFTGLYEYSLQDFHQDVAAKGNFRFPIKQLINVREEKQKYLSCLKFEIEQVVGIKKYTIMLVKEFQEPDFGSRYPSEYLKIDWAPIIELLESHTK